MPKGESVWEWQIGRELLAAVGADYEIQGLEVQARVRAQRESRYLRLHFFLSGWVEVLCDRGGELIRLPIETAHTQVYSWDPLYATSEEEFFVVGPHEDWIDLLQAFYDYIALAIPLKRVRPTCPDAACPAVVWEYLFPSNPS
ncbi:MAG: DUF177 domain-containing protein [Bacteroidia bacterium]|nr:DUF177 domain-containing protein [Bacteroidia bacterium]MDW8089369.1 hypothetical protein [Bacteroidia bacterium]